jgi:hypothetical protein
MTEAKPTSVRNAPYEGPLTNFIDYLPYFFCSEPANGSRTFLHSFRGTGGWFRPRPAPLYRGGQAQPTGRDETRPRNGQNPKPRKIPIWRCESSRLSRVFLRGSCLPRLLYAGEVPAQFAGEVPAQFAGVAGSACTHCQAIISSFFS